VKPLDDFAVCNPKAVAAGVKGDYRKAVSLYVHGCARCFHYISSSSLDNKAVFAATDAQLRVSKSAAARKAMQECDDFVLATRDLEMPYEIRREWSTLVDNWRQRWTKMHGVFSRVRKQRENALHAWQFAKALRKEGLLPCPPTQTILHLP